MSMARTIAILGAGLGGYQAGEQDKRRRQREDENDEWMRKQRARQETMWQRDDAKWQREEAERVAVEREGKPLPVTDGEIFQPTGDDEGSGVPMPANPTMGTVMAGGQRFADRAAADAAVNSPSAQLRRMAGVMADPVRKAQTTAAADAADVSGIQLRRLQEDLAIEQWRMRALEGVVGKQGKLATADDIAAWMTESKADGKGGATKWAAKQEGKTITVYPVGPDGTALAAGFPIEDSLEGRLRFISAIDPRISVTDKLADIMSVKRFDADEANRKRTDARLDAAQKSLDEYHKGMLKIHGDRTEMQGYIAKLHAALAGARSAGSNKPMSPEDTFDRKEAGRFARDKVLAIDKAAVEAGKPPMSASETARHVDEMVDEMWKRHRDRFVLSTTVRELAAAENDPEAYAAAWAKAMKYGLPAGALMAMKFEPPGGGKPTQATARKGEPQDAPAGGPASRAAAANARPFGDWAYKRPEDLMPQVLGPTMQPDNPVGALNRRIYESLGLVRPAK